MDTAKIGAKCCASSTMIGAAAMINVRKVFFDSLRLYFAPLVGAYREVRAELARIARHYG